MKNKKAILGKIIATPFVLILTVVIMAVFILISTSNAVFSERMHEATPLNLQQKDLMLQTITTPIEDYAEKEIFVYDAVHLWLNNQIDRNEFYTIVSEVLNEKNNCYYLRRDDIPYYRSYKYQDKQATETLISQELFLKNSIAKKFKVNGEEIKIMYYYGKCPDE